MKKFCCDEMKERAEYVCQKHRDPFDCPDRLIYYSKKLNVFGLIIHRRRKFVSGNKLLSFLLSEIEREKSLRTFCRKFSSRLI